MDKTVTTPWGAQHVITVPDGASDADIGNYIQGVQHDMAAADKVAFMYDAKGQNGRWVDQPHMADAMKNGWQTSQPTQMEKNIQSSSPAKTALSDLSGMITGVPKFLHTAGRVASGDTSAVSELLQNSAQNDESRVARGRSIPYRVVAGIGENIAPVNARGMEDAAEVGDTGAVLGHTAAAVAATVAPVVAGEALRRSTVYENALPKAAEESVTPAVYSGRPGVQLPAPGETKVPLGQNSPTPGDYIASAVKNNSKINMPDAGNAAASAWRESLADLGHSETSFKGAATNGSDLMQHVNNHAIDLLEQRKAQIFDHINDQAVDLSQYPDLQKQMAGDDGVAPKTATIAEIRTKQIELNDAQERSNFWQKDPNKQGALTDNFQEIRDAARQSRNALADTADSVLGKDNPGIGDRLRKMNATESALYDFRPILRNTGVDLALENAKYNTTHPIVKALNAAKQAVGLGTNPIQTAATFDPTLIRPTIKFNSHMGKVFEGVQPTPANVDMGIVPRDYPGPSGNMSPALPSADKPGLPPAPDEYKPNSSIRTPEGTVLPPTHELPAGIQDPRQLNAPPNAGAYQQPAAPPAPGATTLAGPTVGQRALPAPVIVAGPSSELPGAFERGGRGVTITANGPGPARASGATLSTPDAAPVKVYSIVKGKVTEGLAPGADHVTLAADGTLEGDPAVVKRYQARIMKQQSAQGFVNNGAKLEVPPKAPTKGAK